MNRLSSRLFSTVLVVALVACGALAAKEAYASNAAAAFPAGGEAIQTVDVWTRPGSKGKILFRLHEGDGVTVLEMAGVSVHVNCSEGEGYASANRFLFSYAEDLEVVTVAKGSLYTEPMNGNTGKKIQDSSFTQGETFYAQCRKGKWICVYNTNGAEGWMLASKVKIVE